eukprot:Unigene14953_Nuclearia_a/m.44870 Unigene14953_Nuclearia_a/g.44870  ORF Unigene14953_Nuclearia_a/g.44870 Unigene14953_Nuclearia_a/m.44870 type:complete len:409 (+) Unigene14953_Nuclearia_a:812-2038(+)
MRPANGARRVQPPHDLVRVQPLHRHRNVSHEVGLSQPHAKHVLGRRQVVVVVVVPHELARQDGLNRRVAVLAAAGLAASRGHRRARQQGCGSRAADGVRNRRRQVKVVAPVAAVEHRSRWHGWPHERRARVAAVHALGHHRRGRADVTEAAYALHARVVRVGVIGLEPLGQLQDAHERRAPLRVLDRMHSRREALPDHRFGTRQQRHKQLGRLAVGQLVLARPLAQLVRRQIRPLAHARGGLGTRPRRCVGRCGRDGEDDLVDDGAKGGGDHARVVLVVRELAGRDHALHRLDRALAAPVRALLAALGHEHDDAALARAARAAHALEHARGRRLRVKAHDQVDLANVQALLADRRAHERVVPARLEVAHDLELLLLRQALGACGPLPDEAHRLDDAGRAPERPHNLVD